MKTNAWMSKLLLAGVVTCFGVWAARAQSVVIDNITPASGAQIVNGATVTVGADVTPDVGVDILGVYLAYSWEGSAETTNEMALTTGVHYEAVIPRLAAGALSNHVFCLYTVGGVTTSTVASADLAYDISETLLDPLRATDFEAASGWAPNSYTDLAHTNKVGAAPSQWWLGENTRWVILPTAAGRPPGGILRVMGLRPIAGAFIRTPLLADGVGTIYYASIVDNIGYGAELAVQYTTNSTPAEGDWQTAVTLSYVADANVRTTHSDALVLNNRDVRYVRFLRLDNGTQYQGFYVEPLGAKGLLLIDNIYASQPPTMVSIAEEQHNPGYPAQDQDVQVRCRVTDEDEAYPSINRQVRVFYSWLSQTGPWVETNMYRIAEDVYEGIIPQHGAGTLYYYFRCDFDGYSYSRDPDGTPPAGNAGPKPLHDENQSPAYLIQKGDDDYRNYEIRRYRSDVQVMRVAADPSAASVDMELIGDDEWQGLTLVSGITNLTWTFQGIQGYTNDAPAYDDTPWMWGDNDQDFPYPPVAGRAERDATNDIVAQLEYDGFLLLRLNRFANTNSYIVKRAVYQNFNVWTADPVEFEKSDGLYTIQTFRQNFSSADWTYDAYEPGKSKFEAVDLTTPGDFVQGAPGQTLFGWRYDFARVVKERDVYDVSIPSFVNRRAIELMNVPQASRVWNTYASKTEGVDALGFKARVSLNDNYYSFFAGTPVLDPFTASATWPKAHDVEVVMRAESLSPAMGSISVLTWLSLPAGPFDSPSYYETRLTQADATANGQERLNVEVYRWKNGVSTKIGATATSQATTGRVLTGLKAVRVEMNDTGSQTKITVRVDPLGNSTPVYSWNNLVFTDTSAERLTSVGTVGFISYDARIEVQRLRVFTPGASTGNLLPAENWATGLQTYWYMGGMRPADGQPRWGTSGVLLLRNLPSQTLGIYVAPMPDGYALQPNLDEKLVATREVTGLGYSSFAVPLKVWNESFVIIKNMATSEINVAVDELALSPWRAVTRADVTPSGTEEELGGVPYYDWSATQQENWTLLTKNAGWLALEGWINTSAGASGGEAQFDRSRANTNLVQALMAPYMTNNIGSIAFDWRANGVGTVVFAIERTAAGAPTTWVPVKTITNATTSGSEYIAIRTAFPGRIRVRVCEGTHADGVLKLDNLIARDNPPADDTSWKAYNVLITDAQDTREFESVPDVKTAYLNNDPTNGVAANVILDEDLAYIQTPKVGTGIGEIAFWYRIWDEEGGPATLALEIAPSAAGPWTPLTNIVVAADQTEYTYYSDSLIYEPENKVLRIYCLDTGNRVCIDNVLMTEPVRAGFDFMSVALLPNQPLVGQPPGLEVTIGRFIMNPDTIRVYVSVTNSPFVSITNGAAVWGYTNWWTKTNPRQELVEVAPRKYRLPEEVTLPAGAIDDVVQYIVWGTHSGIDLGKHQPIVQDTQSYTNAAWYYPVDLNAVSSELNPSGRGADGWSPYYFVYSCPPRSVWVNEIQYGNQFSIYNKEFFEFIGPAGASLANWRVEMLNVNNGVVLDLVLEPGFTLGNVFNGWGFLVWGDPLVESYVDPAVRFRSFVPAEDFVLNWPDVDLDGGVRVIRSNGAWEDRVAWGAFAKDSVLTVGYGFRYAGDKRTAATLALATTNEIPGATPLDFAWGSAPATYGAVNTYQDLAELEAPTAAFFMIYSVIGPNGTHSVGSNPLEMFAINQGESTNIVYTANAWYRIDAALTNNVAVGEAGGLQVYTQALENVQNDISNHVTFVTATAEQVGVTNSVPLSWIQGYYPNEADARADGNLAEDYLLGVDPTGVYDIGLTIELIEVDAAVTVIVKLTDGANPLDTRLNGALKVYGKTTLDDPAWVEIASATVTSADFDFDGLSVAGPFDPQSYRFFKAVIE